MPKSEVALATYTSIADYRPQFGDFVIWTGWFYTWFGIVAKVDGERMAVIFESNPRLLFTLSEDEQTGATRELNAAKIRSRKCRCFIYQDAPTGKIWYV